jgi:hypothetical protein
LVLFTRFYRDAQATKHTKKCLPQLSGKLVIKKEFGTKALIRRKIEYRGS